MNLEVFFSPAMIFLIAVISIWDTVWKILGAWKSGRNNQPVWFVLLLILNTAGILPIIYIIWYQKNKNPKEPLKKVSKKR